MRGVEGWFERLIALLLITSMIRGRLANCFLIDWLIDLAKALEANYSREFLWTTMYTKLFKCYTL